MDNLEENNNAAVCQDVVTDNELDSEELELKYPGCFKKSIAFIIDEVIIVILGMVIFFPFSKFTDSLFQYGWLPGYLLGAVYFGILESSLFKNQSVGKMIFSYKVSTVKGKNISPFISLGRYFFLTLPLFHQGFSNAIASTIGITNTVTGGTVFLLIVGILFAGNTLFMFFHPQKRGLHDIIFRSVVVPVDYKPSTTIINFTLKPVMGGIVGLVILGLTFGHLSYKIRQIGRNPDFSDIKCVSEKIQEESGIPNLFTSYKVFSSNGRQTMFSLEIHVPVSSVEFKNRNFRTKISNKLFPLAKELNKNPKVDTITIVFFNLSYIGFFSTCKTHTELRKLTEIP